MYVLALLLRFLAMYNNSVTMLLNLIVDLQFVHVNSTFGSSNSTADIAMFAKHTMGHGFNVYTTYTTSLIHMDY